MILLDSMVLSELGSKSKDPNVVKWFRALNANQIQIPAFAIYESHRGINKLRREKKNDAADEIEKWIDNLVAAGAYRFAYTDESMVKTWAEISDQMGKDELVDAGILAIGRATGATIATRNFRHFAMKKDQLVNPYKSPAEMHNGIDQWPSPPPQKKK